MRAIEIAYEARNLRPWLAVDQETGEPLLRLDDRDQLVKLCTRLGWHVARSPSLAPKSAA
jgi:hypothetical protein